jgi:ATP-dependent 26S proteasome regulatory subunit
LNFPKTFNSNPNLFHQFHLFVFLETECEMAMLMFVWRPHSQEAVELPLTHPEYYEEMGIRAPKGVILYGCPGTGKTLLAKAVANQTSATFLRVVGSELIQKYSGEGPKLVRELFRVAEENAPSIVFIDEIDAIGTKRYVMIGPRRF